MRISTAFRFEDSVDSLQRRQQDLNEAQNVMTTGKRINRPSDDPTGAARAERAFIARKRVEADQRLIDASRNSMALAESALGSSVDLLQSARELLVNVGNGSYGSAERQAQVAQLVNIRKQVMAMANQEDGAGGFVFSGQSSEARPFLDTADGVITTTAGGQQQLSQRDDFPTSFDGSAVWLQVPTGNGVFVTEPDASNTGSGWIDSGSVSDPSALTGDDYEVIFRVDGDGNRFFSVYRNGGGTGLDDVAFNGQADINVDGLSLAINGAPSDGDRFTIAPSTNTLSPFEALDRAIATLSDPGLNGGQVMQSTNIAIRDLDASLRHLQSARAQAGATLNRLDTVDERNQDRALWAQTVQTEVEDVDMVQALSDFQNKQTGYSAALQSYALVQRMSLLDYIK